MKRKRFNRKLLLGAVILLLTFVVLCSGFYILTSTIFQNDDADAVNTRTKTITRNGVEYFPRQDITVIMLLGIDQNGPVQDSGSYNNSGNADVIALVIFDESNQTTNVLLLNRDTMTELPVLGIGGKPAGTMHGQLALAHSFGSGLEDSCENTREAVSDFLYGIQIDYYVSMNMDAITILNDAVGGVSVNVVDDFSAVDPTIPQGETLLHGEQAIHFLRTRKDVGDQLNVSRMERHKAYMQGFVTALRDRIKQTDSFVPDTYESLSPYIVTDCSATLMSSMLNRYADYSLVDVVSPVGENRQGDAYMEFYADEEALDQLVLDLFYAPKK